MNSGDLCENNVLPSLYTNLFPEHRFGEETVKKVHTAELLGQKERRNLMLPQDTSCPHPPPLEGLQGPEALPPEKRWVPSPELRADSLRNICPSLEIEV